MKSLIVKIIILLVLFFSVFPGNTKEKESEEKEEVLYVDVSGEAVELEEYLVGVVAMEMPYSFDIEALKAQSVAARTYVLQRNLKVDTTTTTQVYRSESELKEMFDEQYDEMYEKVKTAIKETEKEVLTYNGAYISALFYSCNNGYSNNAEDYYQNEIPYLKSVPSKWDKECSAYKKSVTYTEEEIKQKLNVSSVVIPSIKQFENGYIEEIVIGEKIFTGREVRELLGLRSSCFEIKQELGNIIITTYGYGHGVGMSQYGAQGMAKEGHSYQEILKHYYQGVEITNIY